MRTIHVSVVLYPDFIEKLHQITHKRGISRYIRESINWKYVKCEEPPHSNKEKRLYSIRVSSEEAEAIAATADKYGVTYSKIVRAKILSDYQEMLSRAAFL